MAITNTKIKTINQPHRKSKLNRIPAGKVLDAKEVIKISIERPDTIVGVKRARIYAQIAKTGRNPELSSSKAKLIEELINSGKIRASYRRAGLRDYIPMKVKDIATCFGKDIKKMPSATFIRIE